MIVWYLCLSVFDAVKDRTVDATALRNKKQRSLIAHSVKRYVAAARQGKRVAVPCSPIPRHLQCMASPESLSPQPLPASRLCGISLDMRQARKGFSLASNR